MPALGRITAAFEADAIAALPTAEAIRKLAFELAMARQDLFDVKREARQLRQRVEALEARQDASTVRTHGESAT